MFCWREESSFNSFIALNRFRLRLIKRRLIESVLEDEDQEAKQFDLLMLRLQLAVLLHEPSFERLRKQVVEIAGLLYESPFTDVSPRGVEGVFAPNEVDQLIALLAGVRRQAEI